MPSKLLHCYCMKMKLKIHSRKNPENNYPKKAIFRVRNVRYNDTQAEIAKSLGIVQSSVQKSLASSQFYMYKEATDTISQTLKNIIDERL